MKTLIFRDAYRNDDWGTKLFLFVLNPLLGFLYSLIRPASNSSRVIFLFFGLLYAWLMDTHNEAFDFTRIVHDFYSSNMTTSQVEEEIMAFLRMESSYKEIYQFILIWFTKLFSQNYHLLFFFACIPVQILMLKSIGLITNDLDKYRRNMYTFTILLLFIMPFDLFQLSNFRFPTALWISVYSTLCILYRQKYQYIIILLLAPFFHSGLWLYVLFLIVALILRNKIPLRFIEILFVVSIPFAFIESDLLTSVRSLNFGFLPDIFVKWIDHYTSQEMIDKFGLYRKGSGFYWVEILIRKINVLAYIYGVYLLLQQSKSILGKANLSNIKYLLLFITFVNFIQVIPTLGGRYFCLFQILFSVVWFKTFYGSKKNKFIYIILATYMYTLIYHKLGYYIMTLDVDFLYMNLFSLIFKNIGVTTFNLL